MKVKLIKKNGVILLFVITLLVVTVSAYAQTVRGRLDRQGPSGSYPAAYVPVTLCSPAMGRSAPVYTGADGMYYFYNVPPGDYILEIWGYGNEPITDSIQVFNHPYTDIDPILIP